jgi:hypothetical protein
MSRSTRNSRSSATTKGNATRVARRTFETTYGRTTARVVRLIAEGLSNRVIRAVTGASYTSIAAYRANVTRGAYSPFVSTNGLGTYWGTCNWTNL